VVICLEQGADLHTAQLMPLQLTVSCFCKIQIGFAFLVPAHPGSPGQRAVKRFVCVCFMGYISALTYYLYYLLLIYTASNFYTCHISALCNELIFCRWTYYRAENRCYTMSLYYNWTFTVRIFVFVAWYLKTL